MRSLPSGTVTFLFTEIENSTSLWEKYPQLSTFENYQHGALLMGAAGAAREQLNAQPENPFELAGMQRALAQLAEAMGEEERDRVIAEGAKMSLDEAVTFALKETA